MNSFTRSYIGFKNTSKNKNGFVFLNLCNAGDFVTLKMFRYLVLCQCIFLGKVGTEGSLLPENYQLNATVGGYAVMNCHLDFPFGNEIPYQLEWDKDGENIFSWYSTGLIPPHYADSYGGRIQHLRDGRFNLGRGSINLTSIRETDHGIYHCRVLFPNRTPPTRNNGTFYYLEVQGGNLIFTPPMNITCLEGQRVEFECKPKSLESVIKWYKDGEPISDLMDLSFRSMLGDNGSLIIHQAAISDPGEYECHVVNPEGELQSASAFLDVQYKAKVVYAPKERYLPYGKPSSLDCFFSANPPLTNLRWEKDGFLFEPSNVPGVFYSRNGSLLFNEVNESHEGLYSCTPYNTLGTEGPSSPVRVRVQKPPTITRYPQALYLAKLGQRIHIPCMASDGNLESPPVILWTRKDGVELPEGRYSLDGGNITIDDLTEEDRGIYICTARNDAASVSAETELMIENVPPRAPYNLSAVPTHNSMHVSWVPGYNGHNVDYNVWYRARDISEWRTMKILTKGLTEATLLSLQPGTEYEIRILSQDQLGDGLFSKPIFVRTIDAEIKGETMPSYAVTEDVRTYEEPPQDLIARAIEEGLLVTWDGTKTQRRCIVRWYREPNAQLQGVMHTTDNYLLLTEVEEDQLYLVTVSCGSKGAESRVSLRMPAYSRLKTIAGVAGGVAILLAIIAALLYFGKDKVHCTKPKRRLSEKGRRR